MICMVIIKTPYLETDCHLVFLGKVTPTVHPAVVIDQVVTKVAGDWFPKVSLSNSDGGPQHTEDSGDFVEQFEDNVVDVDLVYGEVAHQVGEEMLGHGFQGGNTVENCREL